MIFIFFPLYSSFISFYFFFDQWGFRVESEGDLDGLICILLNRLGFGASAQLSEVRWRGTLVLSGSNATPVASERDTSYWFEGVNWARREVNSAHRNLLLPSFKQLRIVRLETFFHGTGIVTLQKSETDIFWCSKPDQFTIMYMFSYMQDHFSAPPEETCWNLEQTVQVKKINYMTWLKLAALKFTQHHWASTELFRDMYN